VFFFLMQVLHYSFPNAGQAVSPGSLLLVPAAIVAGRWAVSVCGAQRAGVTDGADLPACRFPSRDSPVDLAPLVSELETKPHRDMPTGAESSSLLSVCRAPASRGYLFAGEQRAGPGAFARLAGEPCAVGASPMLANQAALTTDVI